jgi:hypothetical protein
MAERLLRVKRSLGQMPADAHQEIVELIRKCVQQDRARLLKAMQEDPVIVLSRGAVVRWLISVALVGIVLGGVLTCLLVRKGKPPDATPAEAYINVRTGELVFASSDTDKHQAGADKGGDCQPAFYCWKCRQWLPVKNPENRDTTVVRPVRVPPNRPVNLPPQQGQ